jgi:hypothetical protein
MCIAPVWNDHACFRQNTARAFPVTFFLLIDQTLDFVNLEHCAACRTILELQPTVRLTRFNAGYLSLS